MNFRIPHPIMLWMEPSANCNLDCPSCPTAVSRRGGQMQYDDFVRVIDQIPWLRLINLWYRGEPLVAPDLHRMIAEATRRGIYTQTHTNGILLGRGDTAERLVKAGLTRITIGVDGPDEASYRRIRTGGTLAEVEAGARALCEARRKLKSRKPKIIAECLLSNQSSEQFRQVREMAQAWGVDDVKFKTYRVSKLTDVDSALDLLPDNPALWRYDRVNGDLQMKGSVNGCRRLGWSAVVGWNGEVYPCCFWSHDFMSMGNAFEQPWKEIWRGDLLHKFQATVNSRRKEIAMCRNCTEGLPRLYMPHKMVVK